MSILLARTSLASNFIRINPIEQCEHIHIWNVILLLLSKGMISKKNWNHSGKYLLAMVFASVLLSTFGIFTYNAFAENISIRADGQKVPDNHLGNTISSAQTNTNVKHVDDKTNTNHSVKHIKSPPHLPPSIIEQDMHSKHCKCVHTKSS
jgi:hypothetical protein